MPYIGATELSLILPAHVSIGTNTQPLTLGEVGSMIAEISGELDGYTAAAGFNTPIPTTATSAYAAAQRIVKNGVGWKLMGVLFPNMGGPGDKSSLAADYRDAYMQAIKDIRAGKFNFLGAGSSTGESGRALPRSQVTSDFAGIAEAASPMAPLSVLY